MNLRGRVVRLLARFRPIRLVVVWAAGYCVSTVGPDEDRVRRYIREQEERERRRGEFDFG